ncbi:MAG: 50S ribosomal protein L29 [Parcubacteria group bacterium GW2011_GWA2_38_13]|nr:MAG: 50S ribosomal protein L29 [Parcubacteria group bacterium GW2011_GWA2_38_13]
MDFIELKKKSAEELKDIYVAHLEKLKDMRFKIASKQLKNIREIRNIKKEIAQILTLKTVMNTKKNTQAPQAKK